MGGNASRLKFSSLGSKIKVQCHNKYLFNRHIFHAREYGEGKKI
jgi:hypothetical protein